MLPLLRTPLRCFHSSSLGVAVALSLSACSSATTPTVETDPAFFGTLPNQDATNGLEFASPGDTLAALDDQQVNVRVVYLSQTDGDPKAVTESFDTVATISAAFDPDNPTYDLTFDGQTFEFIMGSYTDVTGTTFLSDGRLPRDYVVNIVFGEFGNATFDDEGWFLLGLETDPMIVSTQLGTATYTGSYIGTNSVVFQGGAPESGPVLGDSTIVADFDNDNVDVTLQVTLQANMSSIGNYTLSGQDMDILGNGFAGELEASCSSATTNCSGSGPVSGVFYGPSAENVGGQFEMEWAATSTTAISRHDIVSIGIFTAE